MQVRVVQEICPLRAMWRVLETGLRKLLNGHEDGNVGYSQGVSYGLPRQRPTLPPDREVYHAMIHTTIADEATVRMILNFMGTYNARAAG